MYKCTYSIDALNNLYAISFYLIKKNHLYIIPTRGLLMSVTNYNVYLTKLIENHQAPRRSM